MGKNYYNLQVNDGDTPVGIQKQADGTGSVQVTQTGLPGPSIGTVVFGSPYYDDSGNIAPNASGTQTVNIPSGKTFYLSGASVSSGLIYSASLSIAGSLVQTIHGLANTKASFDIVASLPITIIGPATITLVKTNKSSLGSFSIYSSIFGVLV